MKTKLYFALGVCLMLGSIWAGAFFREAVRNTWASFPTFATAFAGFVAGSGLVVINGANLAALERKGQSRD